MYFFTNKGVGLNKSKRIVYPICLSAEHFCIFSEYADQFFGTAEQNLARFLFKIVGHGWDLCQIRISEILPRIRRDLASRIPTHTGPIERLCGSLSSAQKIFDLFSGKRSRISADKSGHAGRWSGVSNVRLHAFSIRQEQRLLDHASSSASGPSEDILLFTLERDHRLYFFNLKF